ncbi:transglycosylase domain-containing protein [Paenibacillus sp. PL2-23]|uniref:transglycosylase domain-containing protein n=1 Tax=Paenibacillus sp. PL2-23 TaxID=2100729 RepID=UPI0030F4B9DD
MRGTSSKTSNRRVLLSRRLALALGLSVVAMAATGWLGLRAMVAAQDISELDRPLSTATILYDDEGNEAVKLSLNDMEPVSFDQIPVAMIHAIIAVEDRRFYEHQGFDAWSIGRALVRNTTAGHTVQGGSTITQQLAKNVFLTHDRTWKRKWSEVLLASKIEQHYSKDDIMELYLNHIYFGEGAWGIKRAAEVYFGKEIEQLTIAESALLAGLVKAPSALTPFKRPEEAIERRNVVLRLMHEQGWLDAAAYEAAANEPLTLRDEGANPSEGMPYPYFTDQVLREAAEQYGLTEDEIWNGGLRIYTTLSAKMQEAAERVFENDALFPESMGDQLIQAAAAIVDPRTGGVKALVGGRGEQPFRGFNRAVQLRRQPGSTMKPLAVYTPALESGYQPTSRILDEPVQFGSYAPQNVDKSYHGHVTLYEALIHSYNIPAVKLLNEIGMDQAMAAASRFGISLTDKDRTLGLALGGTHTGVSPLQLAEAYGAFANDGLRLDSYTIVRIESASGAVLAERKEEDGTRAAAKETSDTLTAMLQGVVQSGSGTAAAIEGREVAGKTGTTEMPGQGARDNWFVGYTPQLSAAVWLGYDQPDAQHYLTTSSKAAALIFKELMGQALKGLPFEAFPPVSGFHNGQLEWERSDEREEEWDAFWQQLWPGKKEPDKERNDEDEDEDKEERKERKQERKKREEEREKKRGKRDDHDDD